MLSMTTHWCACAVAVNNTFAYTKAAKLASHARGENSKSFLSLQFIISREGVWQTCGSRDIFDVNNLFAAVA